MSELNFPGTSHEKLDELLQIAVGALADISGSDDMTLESIKAKASRVYWEITNATEAAFEKQGDENE